MNNRESRFASCHPAATFLFFMVAITVSVTVQHPAYLLASICGAVCLRLSEDGRKAFPLILGILPLFVILSCVNPLFNTYGERVLFMVFGRPYTLEALYYGIAVAGMLVAAILWFSCYSKVMTSDKFTSLFGRLIPALSLILVMILRFLPSYQRKAAQISAARRCVGKSASSTGDWKEKAADGMSILSALTSWAMEGAIITADSMRCRGYGITKRTTFQSYRWNSLDTFLSVMTLVMLGTVILSANLGFTAAAYTPKLKITPVTGLPGFSLAIYFFVLMIPTMMNLWEVLQWNYLRSRI